jgi:hypothetical protein
MKRNPLRNQLFLLALALTVMTSFTLHQNNVHPPVKYYYWILHSNQDAWFSSARLYANDQEAGQAFKTYCERNNFMHYTRRVEGPFNDGPSLERTRADAKRQWQNSGYRVMDWNP